MKEKKEGNSICKWFKKKEPLSEKTNFDAAGKFWKTNPSIGLILCSENGSKKIKPLELSDPIDISSDEKEDVEDLKTKDEEMAEVESFADVELDEPVFHKLASPKKLRKRSSSIRSVQTEEKEESEDEEEAEEEVPQRRKSSRVRRSVLPEKKDEDENKTEETSELPPRPRSRQENELKLI